MRALERRGIALADLAIGLAATALAVVVTLDPENGGGTWLDSLLIGAVTLPVIWRRRAPLACAAALTAGIVVSGIPTFDQWRCGVAIPAALLVLYPLGTRCERDAAIAGLALVLGGMVFLTFTDPLISPAALAFVLPLCAGVWVAGRAARSHQRLARELAERSAALERRREQTGRLAVEVERMRLAADLEAAVRRHVQEMVELTEQGERTLARDPERARALFGRIESAGRATLDEMRGLLGVLRSDEPPERAPRPTLAQLDALLRTARAGGRVVDLDVEGDRRPLPDGIELAAYRMVEHGLAAVDGGPVTVRVRYLADTLELEVGGRAGGAESALAAARERVAAHGGSLAVQAPGPGRTLLRARLPLAVAHA